MSRARLALLAAAGACCAATTYAQDEATVYSPGADSVTVTIYPGNLALITETRTVTLPDSAATLIIQDVVDTLLPQSAAISGLDRPIAESNFDYNQLTPQSLLEQAVGAQVTLVRTDPGTGVVGYAAVTVLSVGENVVLGTPDGDEVLRCSGLPEGIVFEAIPEELYTQPQLSMRLAAGPGGERTFQVSYLAHGFSWTADYVVHLDDSGQRMNLAGWATVTNSSGRAFSQAELQLVAGRLNVLNASDGGSRPAVDRSRREEQSQEGMRRALAQNAPAESALVESALRAACFVIPTAEAQQAVARMFQSLSVTGGASATYGADAMAGVVDVILTLETFGDYYVYRLPWRTDLGARQTKQMLFMDRRDAAIERIYQLQIRGVAGATRIRRQFTDEFRLSPDALLVVPQLLLRTSNTDDAGLGEPLPAGLARIFDGQAVFLGEALIRNLPAGAEIELQLGRALDVLVEYRRRFSEGTRLTLEADVLAINDKDITIDLEVRHYIDLEEYADVEIERSSRRFENSERGTVWRFEIPPGDATLSYALSAVEIND